MNSIFADRPARVDMNKVEYKPHQRPAVATDYEHGYRMKPDAINALVNYDGGKNALSLGPHHNHYSRLENVGMQRAGREVDMLDKFRRKVDMRIEILSAALYAEGYSLEDLSAKSEQVFGIHLHAETLRACVRRAFGANYRKLPAKVRAQYVKKAKRILSGQQAP